MSVRSWKSSGASALQKLSLHRKPWRICRRKAEVVGKPATTSIRELTKKRQEVKLNETDSGGLTRSYKFKGRYAMVEGPNITSLHA